MTKLLLIALFLLTSCQQKDANCSCKKEAQLTHFIFIGKTMFPQYRFTTKKCDYCKTKENMKHILTVDVQKKGDIYVFTLHHHKKATVLKANSLYDGFIAVEQIVKDGWVQNDEDQTADKSI